MSKLDIKIKTAIRVLQMAEKQAELSGEPVEIAYSGGKDSDVLLQLAKESGINYKAYYKCTTIDPSGTLQHVRENDVTILHPKQNFFDLIKKKGFPSFRFRFCCQVLKEYKILNTACWGVRADESVKRKARYKEFNFCRIYGKKENKVNVFIPLKDFTLKDIKDFVISRKLKLAACYYDESGNIDFNRRLGCMGCPLKSDRGIADFKCNTRLLKAWINAGKIYFSNHYYNNDKGFNDVYELFLFRTFYHDSNKFYDYFKSNNLFNSKINAKQFLENYFNTNL